ncbi:hypothetical protein [Paenochrobactrum pullorum]|uniref:hypothetical protein n=1 Tax=Paenochrobactrum pullorum TaxID=1324351 RepID=UPI0035BC40CF
MADTDRALDLAQYIFESEDMPDDEVEFFKVIFEKFGDLSREQAERGIAIGAELLTARAAECQSVIDACRAELTRRDALGIE